MPNPVLKDCTCRACRSVPKRTSRRDCEIRAAKRPGPPSRQKGPGPRRHHLELPILKRRDRLIAWRGIGI